MSALFHPQGLWFKNSLRTRLPGGEGGSGLPHEKPKKVFAAVQSRPLFTGGFLAKRDRVAGFASPIVQIGNEQKGHQVRNMGPLLHGGEVIRHHQQANSRIVSRPRTMGATTFSSKSSIAWSFFCKFPS